jgi:transcriptional regulator with XRE-family HTH domain
VLIALRKRLKVPQALIEKRAKIDHSRFSKWENGYVELSELELLKVEQCLSDDLASWRTALAELDVARA